MQENFLARSLWFNDLVRKEATEHGMNILPQAGEASVEDMCEMVLASLA